uniref:NPC intracellular cholesterol transporter 2 (Trinotate prediction) n=1 Tax=Myxobolus squamalis TaxID=59785 RepID=A0A6B2G730_MYXSQ
MQLKYLIFFLVVISFSNILYGYASPWTPCEEIETLGTVTNFTLDDCDSEMCKLQAGQNVTGRVTFVSSVDSSSLTISMKAIIFCLEFNYPSIETDACKSSGVECPIEAESTVTFPLTVTVPNICHKVKKSVATLEMFDERGKHLVCINIQTQIYHKSKPKGYRKK